MVGKAHLVSSVLGINDPVIIEVKQVGVAVPVVRLAAPICLLVVDQLPCVLCHKLILLDVLLQLQGSIYQSIAVQGPHCTESIQQHQRHMATPKHPGKRFARY